LPVADAEGQVDTTSLQIDDLHIAAAHSRAEQPG
jgi:hypothetical protein